MCKKIRSALTKAAAFMLAVIMLPCFSAIVMAREADGPERKQPPITMDFSTIRVLITTGNTSYINLDLIGGYRLTNVSGVLSGTASSPYKIKVSVSGSNVKVYNRSTNALLTSGSTLELTRTAVSYTAGYATLTYSANSITLGKSYLGNFRFGVNSGKVQMINTVPLAYYIYGIVSYEIGTSAPEEALKAQAVAAKTFGMYYIDPSNEYDLDDSAVSMNQLYRGYSESRLSTMPACLAVVGKALVYDGNKLLPAQYSNTNGGETSLPSHLYGSSVFDPAYGVAVDDIEFNNDTTASHKEIVEVTFGGTGDSSRFRDFILCKARDSYGIAPKRVVSINSLYAYDPVSGTTRNMRKLHIGAVVEYTKGKATANKTVSINCDIKDLKTYQLSDLDGSGDSYSSSKGCFTKNLKLYWGKTKTNGYTLISSRNGHGIGLSQLGAIYRARIYNQSYSEILAFYYPNCRLVSITEANPETAQPTPTATPTPTPTSTPTPTPTPTNAPDDGKVLAFGVCTVEKTVLRGEPDIYSDVLGIVRQNEYFEILGATDNGWYKAVWNGNKGYITLLNSEIAAFPSPVDGVFTLMDGEVSVSSGSLRSQPWAVSSTLITTLPRGTKLTSWLSIGKWHYITTDEGHAGFMSENIIAFGEPYEFTGVYSLPARFSAGNSQKPSVPGMGSILPE